MWPPNAKRPAPALAGSRPLKPSLGSDGGKQPFKQPSNDVRLLRQYRNARDELNAGLALLERAINLREMLTFGLDLDDMAAEVAAFKRAANAHKAKRRMRS